MAKLSSTRVHLKENIIIQTFRNSSINYNICTHKSLRNVTSLKLDFHINIISREILDSSNLIGFAQFSAKKVENISTFFNFARNITIENGPIFEFRINFFKWKSGLKADFHCDIISREILHSSNLIGFA